MILEQGSPVVIRGKGDGRSVCPTVDKVAIDNLRLELGGRGEREGGVVAANCLFQPVWGHHWLAA